MASPSSLVMLVICSLVIVACSAQQFYSSGGRYGKRGDKPSSGATFWSGVRYGRSGGGRRQNGGRNSVAVVARKDKFFVGSRYGKRSDLPPLPGLNEIDGMPEALFPVDEETNNQMTCLYTGMSNLYRCYRKENSSEESNSVQMHNQ